MLNLLVNDYYLKRISQKNAQKTYICKYVSLGI